MTNEITEHIFRVVKLSDFYRAMPLESIEAFNMNNANKKVYIVIGDGETALEAIEDCCRNMREDNRG